MRLPGFRASCLVLSGLYVVIAVSMLARGVPVAMGQYGIPAATLTSPHYTDAMFWVFLHMTVIGAIIGVVGWFGEGVRLQRAFSRLMLLAILVYTGLDVHTADWSLGTALYKGPQSLAPVVVDLLAVVLWARLNVVQPVPAAAQLNS